MLRDARHMGRGLRRSPGFTIAVVLTLALGIGANTAIFSIVDQLLLRPLPYPEGENLVMVYEARNSNSHNSVSPATWLDWQRDNRTLERVAAWAAGRSATLTGVGEATRLGVQAVSAEFFPLLRVTPISDAPSTRMTTARMRLLSPLSAITYGRRGSAAIEMSWAALSSWTTRRHRS